MILKKYDLIIYGKGLAGLLIASKLYKTYNILIISKGELSNSKISGGELLTRGLQQKSLFDTIVENGKYLNDIGFLELFLENIEEAMTNLSSKYDIKTSFLGGHIHIGKILLDLENKIKKHCDFLEGEISNLYIDNKKIYGIEYFNGENTQNIFTKSLVFATGGFANLFAFNDYISDNYMFSPIGVAIKNGIIVKNLEFVMFHPFGSRGNSKLLNGYIAKTDHLAGKEVVDKNAKRIIELEKLLSSHNAHQNFSKILKIFYKNKELFIGGEKKSPLAHYTIGGIKINKKFMTNIKGIFAFGEISSCISGASRVGGVALSEIIVLHNQASLGIDNYLNNYTNFLLTNDISDNKIYDFYQIQETKAKIKNLLSFELIYAGEEKKFQKALKQLYLLPDNSYKYIAISFILSMIKRKESIGSFYRLDYPKKGIITSNLELYYNKGEYFIKRRLSNNLFRLKMFFIKKNHRF